MVNTRSNKSLSALARGSRITYLLLTTLFTVGIGIQVFLAGMGVLVSPIYFAWHETFAHFIEAIPLLMIIAGALGRLSWRLIALTALLFVLFLLQYVFLYLMPQLGLTPLRALHTVNALVMFWLPLHLAKVVWQQLQVTLQHQNIENTLRREGELEGGSIT